MFRSVRIVAGTSFTRTTTLCLIAYGVAMAATSPFQSLFAVNELGMTDRHYSLFMFAAAAVGVVSAVSLGAISDSLTNRKPLILWLAAMGIAGYGLVYWAGTLGIYMLCMLTLIPLSRSMFSLLFSGMRRELEGLGKGDVTAVNSLVRALFALSWILVPGLVALWIKDSSTLSPVFLIAALSSLFILLAYSTIKPSKPAELNAERMPFTDGLRLLFTGPIILRVFIVSLGNGAHALHTALHPLIMTGPAGGTIADVGIFAGLLAALEIPFMLYWAYVAQRRSISFALGAALLVYAIYAALLGFASSPWQLFALGILNSCGAAAVLSLPMSYFQDMITDRPGLSTSLVPVMSFFGGILSAAGFALGTFMGDYSSTAWIIALMCLSCSLGLILVERRERS